MGVEGDSRIDDDAAVLVEVVCEVGATTAEAEPGGRAGAAEYLALLLDHEAFARIDIGEAASLVEQGNDVDAVIQQLKDLLAPGVDPRGHEAPVEAQRDRLLD